MAEERYRKFFLQADSDNNGYLTVHELIDLLRKNGYDGDDETIKLHFGSADVSDDDKISYDEFMQAMGCGDQSAHKAAEMRAVFKQFDMDGSGTIDKKELQNVLNELGGCLTEEEAQHIIEMADSDGSETLSYEEFVREVMA